MADNFIQIGGTRIKKSNIKNFGVSSEKIPDYGGNRNKNENGVVNLVAHVFAFGFVLVHGTYNKIRHGAFFPQSKTPQGKTTPEATPSPPKKTHRQYVYVTTYQNDNFKFYEDAIDISKVIKDLEQI